MWHCGEGMGWWMVFGWLWFIIFWGGILALVIWGVRKLTGRGGPERGQSPLDIAKECYARGEISKEEFEQIKKDVS